VRTSSGFIGWIAFRTFTFSLRTSFELKLIAAPSPRASGAGTCDSGSCPEDPGLVVVVAAALHADVLRDEDLHVIDVAAVPDRLEIPLANLRTRMFWTVSLPR